MSGLAATCATGSTTLNVKVSIGYPRKWNTSYATYVKINTLNFGLYKIMLFRQFLTHQCVKPRDFNLSWLAQLATSNFSHVSQIRTVSQFLPGCVAERRLFSRSDRSPSHVGCKRSTPQCFDTLLPSAAFLRSVSDTYY